MWDNLKFDVHKLIGFWKVNLLQGTCLLCQYLMYFGIHLWYSLSYSRNKASSTLRMRKIEKFVKRTFFSKVCPSVHTDPSRKRIFFQKRPSNRRKLKTPVLCFSVDKTFLKNMWFPCPSFDRWLLRVQISPAHGSVDGDQGNGIAERVCSKVIFVILTM